MPSKLFNFVLFILFPSLNQASVRGVAESHKTKIIHREREWRILKWRARDVKKNKAPQGKGMNILVTTHVCPISAKNVGNTTLFQHHCCLYIVVLEKAILLLATSVKQSKYFESSWGIELQTSEFLALMLYHWATETQRWAKCITKFISDASCILLGSAVSIASCLEIE